MAKLNVVKDDFNKSEHRKVRWACYAVWFNLIYHVAKAAIPSFTLVNCARSNIIKEDCVRVTDYRIKIMLYADVIV